MTKGIKKHWILQKIAKSGHNLKLGSSAGPYQPVSPSSKVSGYQRDGIKKHYKNKISLDVPGMQNLNGALSISNRNFKKYERLVFIFLA